MNDERIPLPPEGRARPLPKGLSLVGKRIAHILIEKGMTQSELAKRLDRTPQAISDLMRRPTPQEVTLRQVARALGVRVSRLSEVLRDEPEAGYDRAG